MPGPALLDLPALGDVPHKSTEDPRVGEAKRRDRELDRNLSAVATQPGNLDAPVQDGPLARREEVGEPALVRLAVARRDDRRGQRPPQHLRGGPPEHPLRLGAPATDCPRTVHRDHGVQGGVDDRLQARLG